MAALSAAGRTDDAKQTLAQIAAQCAERGMVRYLLDGGPRVVALFAELATTCTAVAGGRRGPRFRRPFSTPWSARPRASALVAPLNVTVQPDAIYKHHVEDSRRMGIEVVAPLFPLTRRHFNRTSTLVRDGGRMNTAFADYYANGDYYSAKPGKPGRPA